jgi:hypothetical protein
VTSGAGPCYNTPGTPFYGLQSTVTSEFAMQWKWSPLGCQFGHFIIGGGGYYVARGTPSTVGRPTLLAW